jgi:hypothetical protein
MKKYKEVLLQSVLSSSHGESGIFLIASEFEPNQLKFEGTNGPEIKTRAAFSGG